MPRLGTIRSSCSQSALLTHSRHADGRGLLAALRANPSTALIPVIFLSAEAGPEARVDALLAGVDDFLVKVAFPLCLKRLLADVLPLVTSPSNLANSSPGSTSICSSARCAANWSVAVRNASSLNDGLRLLMLLFHRSGGAYARADRERDALSRSRGSLFDSERTFSCRHLHDRRRREDELCVSPLRSPKDCADLRFSQTRIRAGSRSAVTPPTSRSRNGETASSLKTCLERKRPGRARSRLATAVSTWRSSGGVKGELPTSSSLETLLSDCVCRNWAQFELRPFHESGSKRGFVGAITG